MSIRKYRKLILNKDFDAASWIGVPGRVITAGFQKDLPAPHFRRNFDYHGTGDAVELVIAAAGYYEVYINGKKVGDQVLAPTPSNYDRRMFYNRFNISGYLLAGKNTVGIILGNSFYNAGTLGPWVIDKASWRDYPKFMLQINSTGRCILNTDENWQVNGEGPIRYDSIRNGEYYDARLELGKWASPDFEVADGKWVVAARIHGPGGELSEELHAPCRIYDILHMHKITDNIYDSGQNLAGWARIKVKGEAGAEVICRYSELIAGELGYLDGTKRIKRDEIARFVNSGEFQTDKYILKGGDSEIWQPRFTYHGFRYIEVQIIGSAEIISIDACAVGTHFDIIGRIATSDATVNALMKCTYWTFRSNFVGFPTDCPQREKQGWTGDALLGAETGLYNFESASAYCDWLEILADAQRPSGQIPGKAPISGWGYNWGYGPAWDSAIILIPAYVYAHTADISIIRKLYVNMQKYMDFCGSMATDDILRFGLGDYCPLDWDNMLDPAITSTAYYYTNAVTLAQFAGLLDAEDDRKYYLELAHSISTAFNKTFYSKNGIYGDGSMTALATAVYHKLAIDSQLTAEHLNELVKNNDHKINFGMLGAKYVPRVLADYSHIDTAYMMFVQDKYPGWAYPLKYGETTLLEQWNGAGSHNHIMKGDISAWFFRYPGGFTHSIENPGWKNISIRPQLIKALTSFRAEYRNYVSEWKRIDRDCIFNITVPDASRADLILPNGAAYSLAPGEHMFKIQG
ncbi:MAG: hypothetical protein A2X45_15325 [Lentisphaerae bacterium GWF2_50_93]|nr:MAG: hypothetical protein A2X45_15325 [Lentisphaerae bacterium GWF2_50_93]